MKLTDRQKAAINDAVRYYIKHTVPNLAEEAPPEGTSPEDYAEMSLMGTTLLENTLSLILGNNYGDLDVVSNLMSREWCTPEEVITHLESNDYQPLDL